MRFIQYNVINILLCSAPIVIIICIHKCETMTLEPYLIYLAFLVSYSEKYISVSSPIWCPKSRMQKYRWCVRIFRASLRFIVPRACKKIQVKAKKNDLTLSQISFFGSILDTPHSLRYFLIASLICFILTQGCL